MSHHVARCSPWSQEVHGGFTSTGRTGARRLQPSHTPCSLSVSLCLHAVGAPRVCTPPAHASRACSQSFCHLLPPQGLWRAVQPAGPHGAGRHQALRVVDAEAGGDVSGGRATAKGGWPRLLALGQHACTVVRAARRLCPCVGAVHAPAGAPCLSLGYVHVAMYSGQTATGRLMHTRRHPTARRPHVSAARCPSPLQRWLAVVGHPGAGPPHSCAVPRPDAGGQRRGAQRVPQ